MTIYPLQAFGAGDCIFSQTLIRKIAGDNKIVWGILPQFIDAFNRAYPDIQWVDYTKTGIDYNIQQDTVIGDRRIIPIRWSCEIMKVPYSQVMKAKYDMYQQDFATWKEQAMFNRDEAKEQQLYDFLKLKKGMKYNLVNRYFRSNNSGVVDIKPDNDYPIIEMKSYRNFSLFDWARIIEGATEIHVANSAITFILELLKIPKKTKIHLYKRFPDEKDFNNTSYLFTKPYILH